MSKQRDCNSPPKFEKCRKSFLRSAPVGLPALAREVPESTEARVQEISARRNIINLLNSVSDLVSKLWYRNPFDQSEQSKSKNRPCRPAEIRPGRDS